MLDIFLFPSTTPQFVETSRVHYPHHIDASVLREESLRIEKLRTKQEPPSPLLPKSRLTDEPASRRLPIYYRYINL